jgi:hypothetical protein
LPYGPVSASSEGTIVLYASAGIIASGSAE